MSNASITVYEVGPRDGLQNEAGVIELAEKVELINMLSSTGLKKIEAGSFVSPKWVPQMGSSAQVLQQIDRHPGVSYSALTPNLQGLNAAIEAKVDEIAIFAAASEGFSQKNINCSIKQSIERFKPIAEKASDLGIAMRGYVSCVVACPYDGQVKPKQVAKIVKQLSDLGCYEVSLGDTIGVGTSKQIKQMVTTVSEQIAIEQLAIHCHDTYGQALTNIYAALELGIRTIDSSVAGLGGCPYAKGASGNVASEDVVYMLQGMGLECGIDLHKLIAAGNFISQCLGRPNQAKTAQALST